MAAVTTESLVSVRLRAVLIVVVLNFAWIPPLTAISEPGKWILKVDQTDHGKYFFFAKTMFNGTDITINGLDTDCKDPVNLIISWYLRSSPCHDEVFGLNPDLAEQYFNNTFIQRPGGNGFYISHKYEPIECKSIKDGNKFAVKDGQLPMPLDAMQAAVIKPSSPPKTQKPLKSINAVAETWEDSPYMFIIHIVALQTTIEWNIQLEITMKGRYEYISASEWPLMIFYMVMCIIYVIMGVLWLALSACYWRDLLRIQFWIGGVIFLGMIEKAVYYAEFQSIRYDGQSVQGAVVFAEILSAVKRTLARVLVIIASLGYGIVKPRLGALLHRVVGVGLLYLIFSIIEGVLRVNTAEDDLVLLAAIPLAVLDSTLCWWIFISLAQTMKLLRLRRNLVKLSLYRHFTNTLIFAIIASVIFIVWTTKTFKLTKCQSDWRELWIDDAFWRFLFSSILLVIIFLWRPSANNQRYAFSPLVDEISEEEEGEQLMNEAFEGVKMRGMKPETNGSAKLSKVDEDLKWVEENIPSSMADVALPPLLDSDEEIMTTKFEMSKME
ncbi:transmembrane protein 87A-like isoform X2 [Pseudorasbora parva]|uniref:transmembrane protein 87A-like isoform X2 n=1 Tax=Pseudorasbora parva TaxID=51549 RepID=UPI00351EA3D7